MDTCSSKSRTSASLSLNWSSTLIAIEVTEAVYDPEEQILYLRNADASYQVESIIAVNADAAIRELFDRGAVDLTFYPACQEDEP